MTIALSPYHLLLSSIIIISNSPEGKGIGMIFSFFLNHLLNVHLILVDYIYCTISTECTCLHHKPV